MYTIIEMTRKFTAHFKTLFELGCHKLPKDFPNPTESDSGGFEIASKLIFTTLFFLSLFGLATKTARGSDGTFEMRSTQGTDSRCYASSLLMQDWNYTILVSCRDLIYPAENGITNYVLWAEPTDGSGLLNLGQLGYGKITFRSNKAFSSLFVTPEGNPGVREPTGSVVMRGVLNPVTFLDRPTPPTPTIEGKEGETKDEGTEVATGETKNLSTKEKLFLALRRAGIAALIALVALIGLIFVVTRARG